MFAELKRHSRIWVVGPQRAGTRIATKMIAHDTGHSMIDEVEFRIDSLSHLHVTLREKGQFCVIQGPGITRWIHRLAKDADAVVFMFRPFPEIHASENRISWAYDYIEAMKYGAESGSAELKTEFWNRYQRHQLETAITFPYGQLEKHPLWIPKEKRGTFKWNQTVAN